MKKLGALFFLLSLLYNTSWAQPMAAPDVKTIRIIDENSVELCWVVPSLNGNTFNEYQIFYSNNVAGPFNMVQTITNQATSSIILTGLPAVNTSRHFYFVTRFNTNQLSAPSATISSMNLIVIQNPITGAMELNWNAISTPAFSTTQGTYRLFRRILPAPGYTQLSNSITVTSYSDTKIWRTNQAVCNDSIYYRVEVADNNINSCISVSNVRGSFYENIIPETPTLKAVTVNNLPPLQDVTLTWDVSPSLDVKGYYVYQLNANNSPIQVADVPGRLSITTTLTALDGSFPNSLSENYRIAAYDSCGEASPAGLFHNTIFAQTELDACNGIITLSWNKYKNWPAGVSNYEIYVSQNGSPFALLATVGPNDTIFDHFPLIQSTLYAYRVKAIDVTGFLFSESSITEMIADVPVRPTFLYFKYATVKNNRTAEIMLYHDTAADILSYTLYRSDNLGDTFDSIATIPFDPTSNYLIYKDTTKCLTYAKSYVYRAVAYDLCGQEVYLSNNTAKTIFIRLESELDMQNKVTWSDYESWNGQVRSYKVFRGFQSVFSDIPAATIPFGENTWTDDIANRVSKDGEYCYYVQAYQGLDTLFFFADSSRSNKVCVKQLKTFYIPNAFQPDGINKVFKPGSTFINVNNYQFQIFNKWGERVFETIEPSTGWDGTINGVEARMDVYVYRITFQTESFETQEFRGTVTLLR